MVELITADEQIFHLYHNTKKNSKNTFNFDAVIILFPGLPSFVDKDTLVNLLKSESKKKVGVFHVYYPGYWLNKGLFTPKNLDLFTVEIIKTITKGTGLSTFDGSKLFWKFKNAYIYGISFGSYFLFQNYSKIENLTNKEIRLFSPLLTINKDIITTYDRGYYTTFEKQNRVFLKFLRQGYSTVLNGIDNPKWDEFFFNNTVTIPKKRYTKLHIIHGEHDKQISPSLIKNISSEFNASLTLKPIGHSKKILNLDSIS